MKKYIKYILYALVIGYVAFLGIRYLNGWSSPAQTQRKINTALEEARQQHLYFTDKDALFKYVEDIGYIYSGDIDFGWDDGPDYDMGRDDGYAEGYGYGFGDGYYEGYYDCAAGVPYEDQGPPV